jgi:hypothetical protein
VSVLFELGTLLTAAWSDMLFVLLRQPYEQCAQDPAYGSVLEHQGVWWSAAVHPT